MNQSLETLTPLRRETLQTAVYNQMCTLILEGGLAPGESITVASIADAFQVSPMPVREAISRLMAANVLSIVSGRSIGVPELDPASFEDLRNVRMEIEILALRWAINRVSPEFIADLEKKLGIMIAAQQADEVKGFIQANYKFHFAIYHQAGSPILLDIISNLWLRISPYFHLLREFGHFRISNTQHFSIVEAIRSQDVEMAINSLTDDITSSYNILVSALDEIANDARK